MVVPWGRLEGLLVVLVPRGRLEGLLVVMEPWSK